MGLYEAYAAAPALPKLSGRVRCVLSPTSPDRVLDHHVAGDCASPSIAVIVVRMNRKRSGFVVLLSERLRQWSGAANKSKNAHPAVKCVKLRQLVGASNIPTVRTLRLLSCYQAVGCLRLAGPALSFAKPPSDKNQAKQDASRFSADLTQLICRVFVERGCSSCLVVDRGQNAGASAVAPIVSNSGAGKSQADRSQSDVIMSGIADGGR